MRYWWVNQNQTYQQESKGGFLWSPKRKANGDRNPFYDTMREVSPGDVVFSFSDTLIKAISVVTGKAQTGPKPDFGNVGSNWAQEGWFIPLDYCGLDTAFRPKDHIAILRPHLPSKYSPLDSNGNGRQSVYLAEVPEPLALVLIDLIGQPYFEAHASIIDHQSPEQAAIETDPFEQAFVGTTFREQLVRARRGQGVFRANVRLHETACRVTGVHDVRHLRASHIKPWRDANDHERLDGSNGLLLSPHIDHLFDEGYITFSQSQGLIVVPEVKLTLLDAWGINAGVKVGEFTRDQSAYLDYHRLNVFRRHLVHP